MLTRSQKKFFKINAYVALSGLLFGCWVWLSFFRLVHLQGDEYYSLVLIRAPKLNDEIVFNYPGLNSPLRKSKVSKNKLDEWVVLIGGEKKPLAEDLVVGVLLF